MNISQIASLLGKRGAGKPRRPHKKHYSAEELKRRTERLLKARGKK